MPLPRPSRPIEMPDTSSEDKIAAPVSQTFERKKGPSKYKPSDSFLFNPKPDINPYELAELIKIFFNGIRLHHEIFSKLPDSLQRHFLHQKLL
jgi:hypothetical protein